MSAPLTREEAALLRAIILGIPIRPDSELSRLLTQLEDRGWLLASSDDAGNVTPQITERGRTILRAHTEDSIYAAFRWLESRRSSDYD